MDNGQPEARRSAGRGKKSQVVEKVKRYSTWSQKVLAGSCKFGMGIISDLLPTTSMRQTAAIRRNDPPCPVSRNQIDSAAKKTYGSESTTI
jgi:hypothetical protein